MKLSLGNLTTISLIALNVIQAIALIVKTIADSKHSKRMDDQSKQQQEHSFTLQKEQMEMQSENEKLKNHIELKKAELSKEKELEKVKLSNQQFSYNKSFPRAQQVFEEFATDTRKVLKSQQFPYQFPEDYQSKVSTVMLYCPEVARDLEDFLNYNRPFESSGTALTKEKYDEEMAEDMEAMFDGIIKKLSDKLYHKK